MLIESVVADANVLLSAATGKAALRVFTEYHVTVHATRFNADEVEEYLPQLCAKYDLPLELIEIQWKLLPIEIHATMEYQHLLPQAKSDLAKRDPEDAHALALSRCLKLPLWSNDKDFENLDVEWHSTSRLLTILQRQLDA